MKKVIGIVIANAVMGLCQSSPENATTASCQPKNLPRLVENLHREDPAERLRTAREIGDLGCAASDAVAELLSAIDYPDNRSFRPEIVAAIGKIGPRALIALPKLRSLLRDPEQMVRLEAATALLKVEGHSEDAEKALSALLLEGTAATRELAISEIVDIGPDLKGLIPTLVRLLGDPDEDIRRGAIMALGRMGPGAHDATQALLSMPANTRPEIRELASLSSAAVNSDVQRLINALDDKNQSVRVFAAICIGDLGPAANAYLPNLQRCLHSCSDRDDAKQEIRRAINKVEGIGEPCCSDTR